MYEYINYFRENRYCISSSQIFLSFYFSHFFFLFFAPIFSIFLSFPSPPFFTDRSFAPRKAQRSLAQEILIFRGAEGARPLCEPWWITVPVFRMRERVSSRAPQILVSSSRRFTIQLVELVCFEDCIKDCKFSLSTRIDCGLLAISLLRNLIFF